eukprot:CAMPEP_0173113624 /NCGR_PEP_ID=MMETSP1102-20130122/46994_1 /TAXON_ID=49646 /ORGANISM="Geminigera sp., Strain Caron Lab Isolate" /LENGTH=48 /DNA_ID= /DNA_START= /DNA_END= /DNA_ORIENTATION=
MSRGNFLEQIELSETAQRVKDVGRERGQGIASEVQLRETAQRVKDVGQ